MKRMNAKRRSSMKRLGKLAVGAFLATLMIAGCGPKSDEGGTGSEDELVLYTARSEGLNNLVVENFEKETGIKVNTVVAGTGELQKRVESEKENPMGDILWAGDVTMLHEYKDLFMEYVSPEDENMMDDFKNTSGYFTPAFADPTVMIVNDDLIGDTKMTGFEDLLNPELKGKISFGDPTNSSSAFQVLIAMLYDMGDGDPMADSAWEYVDELIQNLDGKIASSSGQVHKGVADGEFPVGLTWEDPAANYVKNGAPVEVVFPEEGAIFPGESVQIIDGANNEENAKKFVDFLISEEMQDMVGEQLTVRPLRKGAKLADYMVPQEDIILSKNYEESWVAENKDMISKKFSEHLEKSMD